MENENKEYLGVFVTGPTGVGKTHMVREHLQRKIKQYNENAQPFAIVKGADVHVFVSVSELVLKSRVPKVSLELYESLLRKETLVLDDLGVSKNAYSSDIVYALVEGRMQRGLKTWVTSNLSLEEIAEKIDDRLASRLSSFKQIVMTGEDRRANHGEHN